MASTVTSEMRPASGRVYGFLNLAALLLVALAVAAVATVYLLRYEQSSTGVSSTPVPYRVLVVRGSQVWSAGPGVQPRLLPNLGVPGIWRGFAAAGDGSGLLVVSKVSDGDGIFLARAFGRPALRLPAPPHSYGAGPWRVTNTAWVGSTDVVVLWSEVEAHGADVVARYSVDGAIPHAEQWIRAPSAAGQAVALSPDGLQLARIETLPAAKGFAGQVQVRLRQVTGTHSSVALQYLGSTTPSAVLWSFDGGTLAIEVPGQGLSIQKSSGRAVHQTSSGELPAAFSPKGAALAYVGGGTSTPRIHVLNLHGEVENVMSSPASGTPQSLGWTPDARALVCTIGGVLYQIDPTNGASQKLPGVLPGTFVGTIPATSPLVR
jgi:hypothetical protein